MAVNTCCKTSGPNPPLSRRISSTQTNTSPRRAVSLSRNQGERTASVKRPREETDRALKPVVSGRRGGWITMSAAKNRSLSTMPGNAYCWFRVRIHRSWMPGWAALRRAFGGLRGQDKGLDVARDVQRRQRGNLAACSWPPRTPRCTRQAERSHLTKVACRPKPPR